MSMLSVHMLLEIFTVAKVYVTNLTNVKAICGRPLFVHAHVSLQTNLFAKFMTTNVAGKIRYGSAYRMQIDGQMMVLATTTDAIEK